MAKPTHPPPPRRSTSKRPPPKPVKQPVTGPMKFGFDHQGIFITGPNARRILALLRSVNAKDSNILDDVAKIFQLAEESDPSQEIQLMKPYWECTKN